MCTGSGRQKRDRLGARRIVDGVVLKECCAFDCSGNKLVVTDCAVVQESEKQISRGGRKVADVEKGRNQSFCQF